MTHTYAVLEVSQEAFDEIKVRLANACYEEAFHDDVIDMHGIALKVSGCGFDIACSNPDCPKCRGRQISNLRRDALRLGLHIS